MGKPLIVSGATEGSPYVECIKRQGELLSPYMGVVVPDRGSWEENTKIKPAIIREALNQSDAVLWIDADCLVDPLGDIPPGGYDLGLVVNAHPHHKIKTSAGFILFRDTPKTHAFLAHWTRLNKQKRKDHPAMMKAITATKGLRTKCVTDWLGTQYINALLEERGAYEG